jgi:hypothetical protein
MKKLFFIIILFLGFGCTNNKIDKEKPSIEIVESELLLQISEFQNCFINGNEKNAKLLAKHMSTSYKEYLRNDMQLNDVDSALNLLFQMTNGMMDDLRSKGAIISNNVVGIKEHIVRGDTLVYLVQNDLIMVVEKNQKKIIDTDFILAISTNYSLDWYFYKPDLPALKNILEDQISIKLIDEILVFVKDYKPHQKTIDLKLTEPNQP